MLNENRRFDVPFFIVDAEKETEEHRGEKGDLINKLNPCMETKIREIKGDDPAAVHYRKSTSRRKEDERVIE